RRGAGWARDPTRTSFRRDPRGAPGPRSRGSLTQQEGHPARYRPLGARRMTGPVVAALLAGLANLLGGVLVTSFVRRNSTLMHVLVAFGAGFMLAVAVL